MRNLGRILLALAALLAAFTAGVLVGRGQRATPLSQPSEGVQISTDEAPAAPVTEPLVAPVQAPPAAEITTPPVDVQVQEDAAAVGMTTRDEPRDEPQDEPTTPPPAPAESTPPRPVQ